MAWYGITFEPTSLEADMFTAPNDKVATDMFSQRFDANVKATAATLFRREQTRWDHVAYATRTRMGVHANDNYQPIEE